MDHKKVCFACGEEDDRIPKLLEKHHVFGRNSGKETVYVCLNCHAKITHYQNKLPPSVRKKSANEQGKHASFLNSIGATLILIGEKLVESETLPKEMKRRGMIE